MNFDFWKGSEHLALSGFIIRAVIIYVYAFLIIKVLGQRSLGTIHPLDFLFAVIIGDVVGNPLSSGEIPLAGPMTAAAMISALHLALSYIALKTPRFRRVIEDEPLILIEKGKILKDQLRKTKMTVESLLMDLRLKSAADLTEIDYAMLESNGQVSVIKKSCYDPATPSDLNMNDIKNKGYPTVVILDGRIVHKNLAKMGTEEWLRKKVQKMGINRIEDIFLMTIDGTGRIYYSQK